MRLQNATTKSASYGRPDTVPCCPRCGDHLFAATAAAYFGERAIGHQWSCEACGYEFRTTVTLPESAAA